MHYFEYGQKEMEHLSRSDSVLGEAISRIGVIEREVTPDPFEGLIKSIVSQQISSKAAETVSLRLQKRAGGISPESICALGEDEIKSCGMSMRKASYIRGIAEAALTKRVDFDNLHELSNTEIIKALSSLNGVGVWTAEMLLIFSLQRPDVISYGDLAIRRGMMNLYGLNKLSKAEFIERSAPYSPYSSVASLYIWALSL